MTNTRKNHLITSAVVLACSATMCAAAAPDDSAQVARIIRPIILHNEQGDVVPMSEPRNGCRQGAPWFGSIGYLFEGYESGALGVSPDGQYVVGYSTGRDIDNSSSAYIHAVAWNACNGIRSLPGTPASASWSSAHAISNTGRHVAGMVSQSHDFGALWTGMAEGVVGFENPNAGINQRTSANGVSADGTAFCGTAQDAQGAEAFFYPLGFPQATMLGDLAGGSFESYANAISNYGDAVVGRGASANGSEAFLWRTGVGMIGLGDLPGGTFDSEAFAVNSAGNVVVGAGTTDSGRTAFRWTPHTGMVSLGDLPGGEYFSEALAVSADGKIIVGRSISDRGDEAFIWTPGTGMRSLRDVVSMQIGAWFADWQLTSARGISSDGVVIVGTGINPQGLLEGWVFEYSRQCPADWNGDTMVNSNDLFDFLSGFFVGDADFSGDEVTNSQDFFEFLAAFFTGC